jgi:cytochrome P450
LGVLKDNPLEAWTEAHFNEPFVRGGLPFMPAVVVSDPDAIRHVLLDNVRNYRKDDLLLRILSSGLRNGLLTVEGDRWRRQRHAVAPMFTRKTILGFAPAMKDAIDGFVARWRCLPENAVVDVAQELPLLTLDVLERTVFSDGIEGDAESFRTAMRTYFDTVGRIDPFDALGLPEFLPRLSRGAERDAIGYFNAAVDAIIGERRRTMAEGRAVPRDLLTLLLEAGEADCPLDESEIRANIITFIAAGHETTANALTWSLYLLSQDEEWASRIAAESRIAPSDEDPCAHLLSARAVLDEALRLYPPIVAISRVAIEADAISNESIPPGTMVIVAPYVVHRHRLLWDNPDAFDPRRFVDPDRDRIHRYAYLPFGTGPRVCIGSAFALQEATLALSAIVSSFRFRLAPGAEVEPLMRITLRPRNGLPLLLEKRLLAH